MKPTLARSSPRTEALVTMANGPTAAHSRGSHPPSSTTPSQSTKAVSHPTHIHATLTILAASKAERSSMTSTIWAAYDRFGSLRRVASGTCRANLAAGRYALLRPPLFAAAMPPALPAPGALIVTSGTRSSRAPSAFSGSRSSRSRSGAILSGCRSSGGVAVASGRRDESRLRVTSRSLAT